MKGYCLTAASNTWSHQRRKRRERERLNTVLESDVPEVESAADMVAQLAVASPSKREYQSSDDEEGSHKKFKQEGLVNNNCYLKSTLVVRKESSQITVEMSFIEGSASRDGLHQVLQHIRNNVKL